MPQQKTRNPLGWGYLEDALGDEERRAIAGVLGKVFRLDDEHFRPCPPVDGVPLRRARVEPPREMAGLVSGDHADRVLHCIGRSFRDLASLRSGQELAAPDVVATPGNAEELARVLEWANRDGLGVIPFGGGSSVVGGVTPDPAMDRCNGCVSLDLQGLSRVLEISERDRVAHVEAGILGPALDAALRPRGLTMRYYPQSYFHSSVGGWIATRGAGHYSTLHAKIEDQVESLGVLLPDGRRLRTRALPASSVGPDPNRLWCGSEGALGVLTDARLRVQARPRYKATRGVVFPDFESALEAGRGIVQAGLWPAQLRILDPDEHRMSNALTGRVVSGALMILGFESSVFPVDEPLRLARELCRAHGGAARQDRAGPRQGPEVDNWRQAFFRQPYVRDFLLDYAVIADTFETAVPWSRLPGFYHQVREITRKAVDRVCGAGAVTCRTTHAYPDGVCLYFSFNGQGRHEALAEQWWEIKTAASDAVLAGGGTISHHHAMGRDHKRWARQELPSAFRGAIRAAKRELDPGAIMNPGLWFED